MSGYAASALVLRQLLASSTGGSSLPTNHQHMVHLSIDGRASKRPCQGAIEYQSAVDRLSYTNLLMVSRSLLNAWENLGNHARRGTVSLGSCIRR